MLASTLLPTVAERLKAETASAHHALETRMDLMGLVGDRRRVRALLERFLGFHGVLEPALQARLAPEIVSGRSRSAALRADLFALGASEADLDRLPRCGQAAALAATPAGCMGALYVLEGSTLGGRMISKALARTGDPQLSGIGYFDPYGSRTGPMWLLFREHLARFSAAGKDDEVIEAANRTFALLCAWLEPALEPAR